MNMTERSATATTGQTRDSSRELALAQQTGTLTELIYEVQRMVPQGILLFEA